MAWRFLFAMLKKVTVRKPKAFNGKALTDSLVDGANEIGREVKKDFEKTVATWKHKPRFKVKVESGPSRISIQASTDSAIYGYIDEGTKVRYATMSQDWISKTKPAIGGGAAVALTPGRGRGRKLFVDRRRPRKGIKARKFSSAITGKWEREIRGRMEKHLRQGVKRSGHAL